MKTEVKTPIIVIAVIAVLAVIVYFGMKTVGDAGALDHGQIKYTPGKPPWLETDPSKRGPGAGPAAAPPPPNGGPNMGAPTVGGPK